MGLFKKRMFEVAVDLYGVADYANSGSEDRPIRAHVDLVRHLPEDPEQPDPLGLLIPLCASRLLSLTRRSPTHVFPIMEVVRAAAEALKDGDADSARRFRVREAAEASNPVTLALPVVEEEPIGSVERSTQLVLTGKSGGQMWGEFKIPRKAANPVITSSMLFATLEHSARHESFERATLPAAAGLAALFDAWKDRGAPYGTSVSVSAAIDAKVIAATLDENSADLATRAHTPDFADAVTFVPKAWIEEAAFVSTNQFEPNAETVLQLGALKMLDLDSFESLSGDMDAITVGNARFGYALRNWECQRVPQARGASLLNNSMAQKLDELDASLPTHTRPLWLPLTIKEIITEERHGGVDDIFNTLPGVEGKMRRETITACGDLWPSDDPYIGRRITEQLTMFGYLLHYAYDLRPGLLDD